MNKNLVCMVNFKKEGNRDKDFVVNTSFAWKKWCDKNNIDFLMWETPLYDLNEMPSIVQRYYLLDILKNNNLSYEQIACVDYDTFPMYYCPNFFNMTNGKFTVALDQGEPHSLNRAIQMVQKNWYPDVTDVNWSNYFNAGFMIYNQTHEPAFMELINFFKKEVKETKNWYRINKSEDFGDDQTIINFLMRKYKYDITILPRSFNVMDYHMNCMFFDGYDSNKRYINSIDTIHNCVNMFHFTGDDSRRYNLTSFLLNKLSNHYE